MCASAAEQVVAYLADSLRLLGTLPTQETLVLERFFDESGGMQLVLHAPFGSRVNRAWALALRKRFCRQFNFELQAAATEEGLLLSLGPQHSFPLADVFRYLHPGTVRDVLIQAFLDAPVFQTRWRWNATISLAVPRARAAGRVPSPLQRMQAEDLLAAAFPDAAACLENIPGDRQIPDHPLVSQTVRDCLEEAMDLPRLTAILERIHRGDIACVARDTPEPSPLCHEILNARPTRSWTTRRSRSGGRMRCRHGGPPMPRAAAGWACSTRARSPASSRRRGPIRATPTSCTTRWSPPVSSPTRRPPAMPRWRDWLESLAREGRATCVSTAPGGEPLWIAAERVAELVAAFPAANMRPPIVAPPGRAAAVVDARHRARRAAARAHRDPRSDRPRPRSAVRSGWRADEAERALLALESDGVVLRGSFTPTPDGVEWCDRRLLARIHRLTLNRLRAEIEPVSPADFMRFLFAWQHVAPEQRVTGPDGLRAVLEQLDGYELAAGAWERHVLPARVEGYSAGRARRVVLRRRGRVGAALERRPPPAGQARPRARSARRRSRCACASTSTPGGRSRQPSTRRRPARPRSAMTRRASSIGCGSAARRSCPS